MQEIVDQFELCQACEQPFEECNCTCQFCNERDECECALFDAATGGG
tara:strand:+ start:655 stop:795 length:141 start_codon:yes stop_codon:yes gene_type:complete